MVSFSFSLSLLRFVMISTHVNIPAKTDLNVRPKFVVIIFTYRGVFFN